MRKPDALEATSARTPPKAWARPRWQRKFGPGSSHEDALDWSVALKPVEDIAGDGALRFNLVWEKSRHLANTEVQPIAATLRQGENGDVSWHHKEGMHRDPRIEKALAMKAKGLSQVAIADELGIDRTTVGRWLKTK